MGMEQMQREQALIKFRNGTALYLVATDLAARGLDIPDINHIIHYHLPSTMAKFHPPQWQNRQDACQRRSVPDYATRRGFAQIHRYGAR